jgi:hypothetical protein
MQASERASEHGRYMPFGCGDAKACGERGVGGVEGRSGGGGGGRERGQDNRRRGGGGWPVLADRPRRGRGNVGWEGRVALPQMPTAQRRD